jgi:hypothetical protein
VNRRTLLAAAATTLALPSKLFAAPQAPTQPNAIATRASWLNLLLQIAGPVLEAASQGQLQSRMPVEAAPGHQADRRRCTHLEAVARTLAGIAPWLEHAPATGPEDRLRTRFAEFAQQSLIHGVDPQSPAWLRFGEERQTIVDAGFLSLALARAPRTLRESLPAGTRQQLASALRATRKQSPPENNWLLFAAMIEAALFQLGESWDRARVDDALRKHAAWYLGDGTYGDGPHYHADYYDSYVIHPFLLSILDVLAPQDPSWSAMQQAVHHHAQRYAAIQERVITPDGSFPPIGRSLTYRCGAFHLLADMALRKSLPEPLLPSQVRCALSAVMQRTLTPPGTFDSDGWLQIGLAGHQPSLGETYISTGSLYLCTAAFLPLGLPADHAFWTGPETPWTAKRIWQGENLPTDHAIED